MMGGSSAQPYAEALEMIKKNCISGNYMDKWNKYAGIDTIPRPKPVTYTSNSSSKGSSYSLNLGSSSGYNSSRDTYKTGLSSTYNSGSTYNIGSGSYSSSRANSLYSVLSAYK